MSQPQSLAGPQPKPDILLALSGRKGSGKDTSAQFVAAKLMTEGYHVVFGSFAGALKATVCSLFNLTREQVHDRTLKETLDLRWNKTPRQLLQETGEAMRKVNPLIWIHQVDMHRAYQLGYRNAQLLHGPRKPLAYIVTDCRYENEAEWVFASGGEIILLHRAQELDDDADCPSEKGVEDVERRLHEPGGRGYVVPNNGPLEELRQMMYEIALQLTRPRAYLDRAAHAVKALTRLPLWKMDEIIDGPQEGE